jgi:SAM-dependent methyltransferase
VPVYYRRCETCGFIFTGYFDAYTSTDCETQIYNDDYAAIDPDFAERRPAANAALIDKMFGAARGDVSLLDYGGGSGKLAEILGSHGWTCQSFDPFHGSQPAPAGRFELVTCFEVFEHTPDPRGLLAGLHDLLSDDGLILFSTLLQPPNIEQLRLNWWYAAPRNGHISLFSKQSLAALCRDSGLVFASFNEGLHAAFRRLPDFAAHLVAGAPEPR